MEHMPPGRPAEYNFQLTVDRLKQGIDSGLHTGVQLHVSLRGSPVADIAIGEARQGVAMRTDTVMRWLSAGKPLTAAAVAVLQEKGRLEYDAPVRAYVPEFSLSGKNAVTLRHVLTHTGGFRSAEQGTEARDWSERVAAVCSAPLEDGWVPGERAGYHPRTGWLILGEIIQRVAGLAYHEFMRREVFLPLGMDDWWVIASPGLVEGYGDRWGELHLMANGEGRLHPEHSTQATGYVCRPGSTFYGPAAQFGRFYRMLLNGGVLEGRQFLSEESVRLITTPQRVGMLDETFRHVMDWGFGTIIDSKKYGPGVPYGYGQYASRSTFGHGGSQSSTAFADSEHGLVVAVVFNGLPGEARHDRRVKQVTAAIYEELGLAMS